jgi:hypothetical protein
MVLISILLFGMLLSSVGKMLICVETDLNICEAVFPKFLKKIYIEDL